MIAHLLRLSLSRQIAALATLAALFATLLVAGLVGINERATQQAVNKDLGALTEERVVRAIQKARYSCVLAQDYIQKSVDTNLTIAHSLLSESGGVKVAGGTTHWAAVNQFTQQTTTFEAPTWTLGGKALTGSRSFSERIPVIDEVASRTGQAVTLFERLNADGDMLRVATSIATKDGQRAIGTYIPAVQKDGSENPVVKAVLNGQTYRGRAFVVNAWYITAYEPLYDVQHNVIGMLFVGVKQEDTAVLSAIAFAGKSGAHSSVGVYYGPHSGDFSLKPVIPVTGLAGQLKSQWMDEALKVAPTLGADQDRGVHVLDPKSKATAIVRYNYYEPWDWIIIIGADSRDFDNVEVGVRSHFHELLLQTILGGLVAVALAAVFAFWLSRRITGPMKDLSVELTSSATQISSSAMHEKTNVTSFMASSNQIASAVKEISLTSQELLRTMAGIGAAAESTADLARDGRQGIRGMETSMQALSQATGSISSKLAIIRAKAIRINSVVIAITKVADQTNLLSLNAAIEAQKAGEAGAGFAVVAREIRRLADLSAQSTLDIEKMVEEMQEAVTGGVDEMAALANAVHEGVDSAEDIGGRFAEIIERVESIAPRYESVQMGMQNQSEGAQQISDAMLQLTETAQQTSDSVRDLNAVSERLHAAVQVLKHLLVQASERV